MVSIIIKEWTTKIELVPAVQKRNAAVLLRKPGRLASQYAFTPKRKKSRHTNVFFIDVAASRFSFMNDFSINYLAFPGAW